MANENQRKLCNLFHFSGYFWVAIQERFLLWAFAKYWKFKIKPYCNLYVVGGHELVRADAECWPSATFGLVAVKDKFRKVNVNADVKNICECGNESRKLGAKLFLVCDNHTGFYCYAYTKTGGTCNLKANLTGKCNTYRVTKGED